MAFHITLSNPLRVSLLSGLCLVCAGCGETQAHPETAQRQSDDYKEAPASASSAGNEDNAPAGLPADSPTEASADLCPRESAEPSVKNSYGTAEVTGCLPSKAVESIMQQSHTRIRICFAQEQAANPKLKGTIKTRVSLDDTGIRSASVIRSDIASQPFIQCVVDSLRQISAYRLPKGKASVDHTVVMEP